MNYAKVELHLHLDGSLNLKWTYDKAKKLLLIDKDMSFEDFYSFIFSRNAKHTQEGFKKFDILCDVMQTKENIIEATYNLVKYLDELGLIYAEIRFASQQHCKNGLSQLEALQAVIEGANKAMKECFIKVSIINCLMHKGDSAKFNWNENLETIEATKQMLNKGACGLDLAGYENNCDFNDYAPLFKIANDYNIPFTIHAGEMGIAEHVIDAINMGAKRIGHGVNCINDEKVLQKVIETKIPLEVCVSSNIKPDYNYASHPFRKLIEEGVVVTLNSDNMIFAKTNVLNEHYQARMLGVNEDQLKKCTINAINAAFISEEEKKELMEKLTL